MKTATSAQKNDSAMMLKLSLLAAAAVASDASAVIVQAHNVPIACPIDQGESLYWDVDGAGGTDFILLINGGNYMAMLTVGSKFSNGAVYHIAQLGNFKQLHTNTASKTVGIYNQRFGTSFALTNGGNVHSLDTDWTKGVPGYFGFRFKAADGMHYGWGIMTIYGDTVGQPPYVISNAYYNNVPDGTIKVGQAPELSSLALLALGAVGVAAWRARRTQA